MPGGRIQLVVFGAQDVYLTANPRTTVCEQLYRHHAHFFGLITLGVFSMDMWMRIVY